MGAQSNSFNGIRLRWLSSGEANGVPTLTSADEVVRIFYVVSIYRCPSDYKERKENNWLILFTPRELSLTSV